MENKANDLSNITNINVNEPRSLYTVYSQSSTFKSPIVGVTVRWHIQSVSHIRSAIWRAIVLTLHGKILNISTKPSVTDDHLVFLGQKFTYC